MGGMPYLANLRFEEEPCRQYLTDVYNSVVLNDVIRRNSIRDVDLLTRIVACVIGNIGNTFASTSVVKFLKNEQRKVAPETVLNYIKYCTDVYLFYKVNRRTFRENSFYLRMRNITWLITVCVKLCLAEICEI